MCKLAVYNEVVDEVLDELRESIAFAGAPASRRTPCWWIGLGFAKERAQLRGARQARRVQRSRPASRREAIRKGFLTRPLPKEISATERDWPTAAAVTAVMAGAHIVRVHAVGNGSRRAGSRRNSEVSSRALMEWLPQLAQLLRRPAVSWWDVVDIVLVSFLIYELLLLIRGTRAVQMALSAGF